MSVTTLHRYRLQLVVVLERFSFYMLLAVITFFLTTEGWRAAMSQEQATSTRSLFRTTSLLLPLFGGFVMDRWLSAKAACVLGSAMFVIGLSLLASPFLPPIAGLLIVAAAHGLFRPGIVALIGTAWSPSYDAAFLIFQVSVNAGALLAPIVAEVIMGRFSPAAVITAAILPSACVLSIVLFLAPRRPQEETPGPSESASVIPPALILSATVAAQALAKHAPSSAGTTQLLLGLLAAAMTTLLLWYGVRTPGTSRRLIISTAVLVLASLLQSTTLSSLTVVTYVVGMLASTAVAAFAVSLIVQRSPSAWRGTAIGGWYTLAGLLSFTWLE